MSRHSLRPAVAPGRGFKKSPPGSDLVTMRCDKPRRSTAGGALVDTGRPHRAGPTDQRAIALNIDPLKLLIAAIGLYGGFRVYCRPFSDGIADATPRRGDLLGGAATAASIVLVLGFLLGYTGEGEKTTTTDPRPASTVHESQSGEPSD